jgi:two-component system osmolarity sensor histidine kinase EnvZ
MQRVREHNQSLMMFSPPSPLASRSMPMPAEGGRALRRSQVEPGLSLFWRTFFLLAVLLLTSIATWLQTFRTLESEPRAVQNAQQVASLINLSRAGLRYSDSIARVSLIKTLAEQEGVRIKPRRASDRYLPLDKNPLNERISHEIYRRMGDSTVVAKSVNDEPGLWVGFSIEEDPYWLQADLARVGPSRSGTWAIWLTSAAALSLAGAALIAGLINRPLQQLSLAASRMREGDFDASLLDEKAPTSEIREVNIGFNEMARQLSKMENDRAIMMAGISHDLRTPLARLRLETELSVSDESARSHMAADISQLDAIIDKFMDYARPDPAQLQAIGLDAIVKSALFSVADYRDLSVTLNMPAKLTVMADEVELLRVLTNLLENARRYGKTPGSNHAEVDISAKAQGNWVMLKIRDHGAGVPEESLRKLTRPFYRGDEARTSATGAGLGLAIVDKTIARMGGAFSLANSDTGGLAAHIRLRRVSIQPT